MKDYVWVGYDRKPPYLPCAVADSASELAREMGTSMNYVLSTWCHYLKGRRKTSRFHKVMVATEQKGDLNVT